MASTNIKRALLAVAVSVGALTSVGVSPANAYYWGGASCGYKGGGEKCQNGGGTHSWQTVAIHTEGDNRPGFCVKTWTGSSVDGSSCLSGTHWASGHKAHFNGALRTAYGYWAGGTWGPIPEHVNADTNWT